MPAVNDDEGEFGRSGIRGEAGVQGVDHNIT